MPIPKPRRMTTEDMQKVADAMGLAVHRLINGQCTTNPVGVEVVETVYPAGSGKDANDHGLGENIPLDYATPKGDGSSL